MEVVLILNIDFIQRYSSVGFNPCFNGSGSNTQLDYKPVIDSIQFQSLF